MWSEKLVWLEGMVGSWGGLCFYNLLFPIASKGNFVYPARLLWLFSYRNENTKTQSDNALGTLIELGELRGKFPKNLLKLLRMKHLLRLSTLVELTNEPWHVKKKTLFSISNKGEAFLHSFVVTMLSSKTCPNLPDFHEGLCRRININSNVTLSDFPTQ